jgi:hypothetical protein
VSLSLAGGGVAFSGLFWFVLVCFSSFWFDGLGLWLTFTLPGPGPAAG